LASASFININNHFAFCLSGGFFEIVEIQLGLESLLKSLNRLYFEEVARNARVNGGFLRFKDVLRRK
jgi:hypothetical protein